MSFLMRTATLAAMSLLSTSAVWASNTDVMTPIVAVSQYVAPGLGDAAYTVDQSGLSATYTPLVTNFDTFVASTTHSPNDSSNSVTTSDLQEYFTYDLGAVFNVTGIALWTESNLDMVRYAADTDGIANNGNEGPFFSLGPVSGSSSASSDHPLFTSLNTRYVSLWIEGDVGFVTNFTVNEVAFAAAVPEPANMALMLAGLGAFGAAARRRKVV